MRRIGFVPGTRNAIRVTSSGPREQRAGRQVMLGLICAAASALTAGIAFKLHFNLSTAGSLEFLLVVLAALRWGFLQATVVSLASLLCLNYLFTAPLFQLTVADSKNLISLVTFEATALLVSRLSSEVKLHAAEAELERRRNSKLYELSRAILLIDVRQSTVAQVVELIRELIEVEEVAIWSVYELNERAVAEAHAPAKTAAHEAYERGKDEDDPAARTTKRLLRIGTTPIGALVLTGWSNDPLLADAVASLVAIALERARSIAQENRAEAERNIEQLRTAVLDGLAHSYKTPLTAIQTASSGLLAIQKMTETQTELVSIIDDQAMVLSGLTTRLLQTAALEGQQVKLRRTSVSLRALVRAVVEDQEGRLQERIAIHASADLLPVMVDADLLKLALTQLIDNAAKYSTVDRMIDVSLRQEAVETVITVANEGEAIPVDERLRIFQRFYRGVDSVRGPTGTGLGLSIVKKTAEAHGGRAWVDFENGANRFSISIPNYKEVVGE